MTKLDLLSREIIVVEGDDCQKFLQSISSNDVNSMSSMIYNLALSSQGRFIADFFVHKKSDCFLLEISKEFTPNLIEHFKKYRLRAKVTFESAPSYQVIYSKTKPDINFITSYQDPRHTKLGYRTITDSESPIPLERIEKSLYLEDKYNLAIPDGNMDLVVEKSLVQEFGLDDLNGISYNKGCYLGQELVSRTKSQGVIRKKIYQTTSSQDLSTVTRNSDILAGDQKIGILCSSYKNTGIALIREPDFIENKEMELTVNNISINLSKPEWRK